MSPGIGVIFSCGRTGTNLVLECLTGNPYFTPSNPVEDKLLFVRDEELPDRYLTKCDTVYCPSYQHFKSFMEKNINTNVIWTLRHPYDMCLSKMYRGKPAEKRDWRYSADATPEGCIKNMTQMYELLKQAEQDFPLRILRVKMEDILTDIGAETKRICKHFCILWDKDMMTPHLRMRHKGKHERYPTLDTSQIDLYKNIGTLYGGYFKDRMEDVQKVFDAVGFMIKEFNYHA